MNLIGGLISGAEGYLMSGSPATGLEMGAMGAFAGGGATAGNFAGDLGNAGLGALDAQDENFQLTMYGEQIRHQERMQMQSQAFDEMMDEKSEQMREINTLRDVQMAQHNCYSGNRK